MTIPFIEKRERLGDPVATTGDRLYVICSQNGLFATPWSTSHVPHELGGVWAHPIKLLDGFWLALANRTTGVTSWLMEADGCRVYGCYTEFHYRIGPLQVTRRDFVPDGLAGLTVTLTVERPPDFTDQVDLIALVQSDLRPAWLGEEVGMTDAPDQVSYDAQQQLLHFQDVENPWVALVGSSTAIEQVVLGADAGLLQPVVGPGATARLHLRLQPQTDGKQRVTLYMAGATTGLTDALNGYQRLRTDEAGLLQTKEALYNRLSRQTRLETPEAALNQAFHWSKLTGQMLARQTDAYGPALGAGLPNYPWWFGIDTEYAVLPLLQAGLFDLTQATLRLLKTVSEAHNATTPGRVIHELSTTGIVYNPGNLVETPAFTRAVYQTWCWTGDRAFLDEMYPFCKVGLLDYTLQQCDADGDLCPAGRSLIETLEMHADLECIDVASYTWEALSGLVRMAQVVGDKATVMTATAIADALATRLRDEWWVADEGLFADVRASVEEVTAALARIDALESEPEWVWMKPQAEQAHRLFDAQLQSRMNGPQTVDLPWLLRHWVVICPLEVGLATPAQAARTFQRLLTPEFCNEWGMFLHPDRHDVMSINTGVLALALVRYGRIADALTLMRQMAATLTMQMPGAISEALPDQWCFLQLWSALGMISPIVEGMLGITPQAGEQVLQVIPQLPADWSAVTLEELRVGNAHFAIRANRTATSYRLSVQSTSPNYRLRLGFYLPNDCQVSAVHLNGSAVPWRWETTNAGRRLCCEASGQADLVVDVESALSSPASQ